MDKFPLLRPHQVGLGAAIAASVLAASLPASAAVSPHPINQTGKRAHLKTGAIRPCPINQTLARSQAR